MQEPSENLEGKLVVLYGHPLNLPRVERMENLEEDQNHNPINLLEMKKIDGWPDYRAGSDGIVYSRKWGKWRPMKPTKHAMGYPRICLCANGKKTNLFIHRIICEAFHGKPSHDKLQVCHKDGTQTNSNPTNLSWGTQSDNWVDRKRHGRGNSGEHHPMSKLSDKQRNQIVLSFTSGFFTQKELSNTYGVGIQAIRHCVKTWKSNEETP